jgi:CheY-like chemotaxis protein
MTASILLVDDRPENLLALEAVLEPIGRPLERALSGDEALK